MHAVGIVICSTEPNNAERNRTGFQKAKRLLYKCKKLHKKKWTTHELIQINFRQSLFRVLVLVSWIIACAQSGYNVPQTRAVIISIKSNSWGAVKYSITGIQIMLSVFPDYSISYDVMAFDQCNTHTFFVTARVNVRRADMQYVITYLLVIITDARKLASAAYGEGFASQKRKWVRKFRFVLLHALLHVPCLLWPRYPPVHARLGVKSKCRIIYC